MKFCTDTMLNFFTLGFYARCSKKSKYPRWLDRSIRWQGKEPAGFNSQFRSDERSGSTPPAHMSRGRRRPHRCSRPETPSLPLPP